MRTSWLSMKRGIAARLPLALFLAYGAAAQIAPAPDPTTILQTLEELHETYRDLTGGTPYTTPGLEPVDPDLFGIALATVEGETYGVGDSEVGFAIQSISKAFLYGLALEDHGREAMLDLVGVNATGLPFGSVIASDVRTPLPPRKKALQNPMVSAGAIATVSVIDGDTEDEKWARTRAMFARYAGEELALDEELYEAVLSHSDGSLTLAYLLSGDGMLYGDPSETVARYLKGTSQALTTTQLAIMGATLANGGVNPMTQERALSETHVQNVLSAMVTAGLYDGSGRWFFRVGLPAKSGVGGGLVAVVPGRFGVAVYAPPLDSQGNSVRGAAVIQDLSERWSLHLFGQGASR